MRHHSADGPAAVAAELTSPAAAAFEALLAEPGAIVDVDRTISDCLASLETRSLEERSAAIQRLLVAATGSEKDRLLVEKQRIWQEIRKLATGGPNA